MKKETKHLEEYIFKYIDKVVIDIQSYEENKLHFEENNAFLKLYQNSTLAYFTLLLRSLIDNDNDQNDRVSSITIFLKTYRDNLIQGNIIGANENYIISLEEEIKRIRKDKSLNCYFAHLNTAYFSDIVSGSKILPDIDLVIKDLKLIIGSFTKLITGCNLTIPQRNEVNIGII